MNWPYKRSYLEKRKTETLINIVLELQLMVVELRSDCDDMKQSYCTRFIRCKKCDHLHDVTLICTHCGYDYGDIG